MGGGVPASRERSNLRNNIVNAISRRHFFGSASAVVFISACSATAALTQADIDRATTFLTGAQAAYAVVKADYPLAVQSIDPQVQISFAKAQTFLASLSTALPNLANATNLTAVVNNILSVANLVASVLPVGTVPPDILLGFQAIEVLAPILLSLAQSLAPSATAKAVMTPTPPRFVSGMSPAAAEDTLRALAGK